MALAAHSFDVTLFDRLLREVADAAAKISGINAAYINPNGPDGPEFAMVGDENDPDLYEAVAAAAVEIQEKLAPEAEPLIDGGYAPAGDGSKRFAGWLLAYRRP